MTETHRPEENQNQPWQQPEEDQNKSWYHIQYGIIVRHRWDKVSDPEWRTKLLKEIALEDKLVPTKDTISLEPWTLESLARSASIALITDGAFVETEEALRIQYEEWAKFRDSAY